MSHLHAITPSACCRLRAGGIIGDLDEERNVAEVLDVRAPVSRLGVAILLASIGLWVLNAELLQHAYTPEWEKPFCQGLMLKGSWSIMLVAWCGARRWQRIFEVRRHTRGGMRA